MLSTCCALYILTSKCASCHNGVQFFISHLTRCLRTRRFSEPTFRPSGATNHWHSEATYLPFGAPAPSFFWLFLSPDLSSSLLFSSLPFPSLLFSSLTLPTSAFPSVHIVGSLTSKLNFLRLIILFGSTSAPRKVCQGRMTDSDRFGKKNFKKTCDSVLAKHSWCPECPGCHDASHSPSSRRRACLLEAALCLLCAPRYKHWDRRNTSITF